MRLLIRVSDTGIGMTMETKSRLFQPFMQADSSITREYGGTGLGLSICKSLVELMNGEITVESAVGVGSTFQAQIEVAPAEPPTEVQPNEVYAVGSDAKITSARVLVAEDNLVNQVIIKRVLQKFGVNHVQLCNDGQMVYDAYMHCPKEYELVLMVKNCSYINWLIIRTVKCPCWMGSVQQRRSVSLKQSRVCDECPSWRSRPVQ